MAYIVIPIELSDINKYKTSGDERISHYEAQIKTITEDFNLERDARTKAHQRAEDFAEEVKRLKSQLEKQQVAIREAATKRCGIPRYECDGNTKSL